MFGSESRDARLIGFEVRQIEIEERSRGADDRQPQTNDCPSSATILNVGDDPVCVQVFQNPLVRWINVSWLGQISGPAAVLLDICVDAAQQPTAVGNRGLDQ